MFNRIMQTTAVVAVLAGVTACSTSEMTDMGKIGSIRQEDRSPDAMRKREEAVNFFREAPVTLLESAPVEGIKLVMEGGDRVPDVTIREINATPMKFAAILEQVAQEANLSWRFSGKGSEALMTRDVFYVQRNEAPLSVVLDELSRITDSFISMKGDRIVVAQDSLFVVRVPRMENSQDILGEGLQNLGAKDIFRDKLSGTITFRATRPVFEAAQRLMKSLEGGRDMIVYDFWLIERVLSDEQSTGIDLSIAGAEGSSVEGGVGVSTANEVSQLGVDPVSILTSGNLGSIDIAGAVRFLRTLGDSRTLSRPTVSLLSGAESSFKSGEKLEYISELNSTANEGVTDTGNTTEELETGLDIKVTGTHNGGVISTKFELKLSELLEWQEFSVGEGTLRLPRTSDRELNANLEARPGDVMVLGGIIRDRNAKRGLNVPATEIYPYLNRDDERVETIILVRPRLVQIRPTGREFAEDSTFIEGGVHSLESGDHERAVNREHKVDAAAVIEDEARARRAIEDMAE